MSSSRTDGPASNSGGSKSEIRTLTSLRGMAALGVVIFHFRDQFGTAINLDRYTNFFSRSFLLVDFFFVLSGFVIALSYTDFFRDGVSTGKWGTFLLKRLGRIYPLHVAVLAGFVASEAAKYLVATTANPPFSVNTFGALIANLLLVQSWGMYDYFTWNHPAWSISTEWFAYLIFPFLAVTTSKMRSYGMIALVVAACFIELEWLIKIGGKGDLQIPISLLLLRCVPSFILGMLVYQLTLCMSGRLRAFLSSDAAFIAALLATVLTLAFRVSDLFAIGAFFFTVLTGSTSRGRTAATLSNGVFYFLGEISYSIYLVHTLLQRVWQMLFQVVWHNQIGVVAAWICLAILLASVLAVSTASYHLIEKPGRDFVAKRLLPRLKRRVSLPERG